MVTCEGKGVSHAALYHAEDHCHVWHEVCYCLTIVACFASILYQNHLSYVKDLLRATHPTIRPSYLIQIPSLLSPRPRGLSPDPPLCPLPQPFLATSYTSRAPPPPPALTNASQLPQARTHGQPTAPAVTMTISTHHDLLLMCRNPF